MEIKKVVVNGNEYEFVNDSVGTRSGFAHTTSLFKNGYRVGNHRCNYLNRTWECYRYQTVMQCCVNDLLADREGSLKTDYKKVNMISRMTAKRNAEFQTILLSDAVYKELQEVKAKLK